MRSCRRAAPSSCPRAPERIEAAKADWKARRFDVVPGDEIEFVPLPER